MRLVKRNKKRAGTALFEDTRRVRCATRRAPLIPPADLKGHILYPLNQLKNIYPSLYVTNVASYHGREAVLQARLPILDCLWNDVIHFSPVHPSKVQQALADAGFARKQRRYYEVDPLEKGFNATSAVIFLHQRVNLEMFEQGKHPLTYLYVPHILYQGRLDIRGVKVIEVF